MNTTEAAKLLGVSVSTIQRWVKQLELPMERNERGHYLFNSDDLELLKGIKEQIQQGALLQEISPIKEKKTRRGIVKTDENDKVFEKLEAKMKELELNLYSKADSVASYQLLQHRREIEDLQNQVKELSVQLEKVQQQLKDFHKPVQMDDSLIFDQGNVKRKKKNFVRSIFGI